MQRNQLLNAASSSVTTRCSHVASLAFMETLAFGDEYCYERTHESRLRYENMSYQSTVCKSLNLSKAQEAVEKHDLRWYAGRLSECYVRVRMYPVFIIHF